MSKRILVVEDQDDNRRILRDLLSSAGFAVLVATTGEEGVKLAGDECPDRLCQVGACRTNLAQPAADKSPYAMRLWRASPKGLFNSEFVDLRPKGKRPCR
jgi:CheY-like chemotaxis protein